MIHDLLLAKDPFRVIKKGLKVIEMRLNDEKRKNIQVGDEIRFTNQDTGEIIMANVIDVKAYKDFFELYKDYPKNELGYEIDEIANPEDMYIYYSKERIEKYGTLAIRIKTK